MPSSCNLTPQPFLQIQRSQDHISEDIIAKKISSTHLRKDLELYFDTGVEDDYKPVLEHFGKRRGSTGFENMDVDWNKVKRKPHVSQLHQNW
jgi:hypothetical protein